MTSQMTSYFVNMLTEHLKLLELLSTSSCVNLVTIALMVFKLHRGGGGTIQPDKIINLKQNVSDCFDGREFQFPKKIPTHNVY